MPMLCARCGYRDAEPQAPTGWCAECGIESIREKYGQTQRAATLSRRESWRGRSRDNWDRDRQRAHRLKEAVRPVTPASSLDPWELAHEALTALSNLRSVRMRPEQHARLDLIAETIRRLAFGPDDEPNQPTGTKTGTTPMLSDRESAETAGRSVGRAGLEPATGGL
jgi:hypothetical protein